MSIKIIIQYCITIFDKTNKLNNEHNINYKTIGL
jgi:hypothetical protein